MQTTRSISTHFEFSGISPHKLSFIKYKLVQRYSAGGWIDVKIVEVGPFFKAIRITFDSVIDKDCEDALIKYVEKSIEEYDHVTH